MKMLILLSCVFLTACTCECAKKSELIGGYSVVEVRAAYIPFEIKK